MSSCFRSLEQASFSLGCADTYSVPRRSRTATGWEGEAQETSNAPDCADHATPSDDGAWGGCHMAWGSNMFEGLPRLAQSGQDNQGPPPEFGLGDFGGEVPSMRVTRVQRRTGHESKIPTLWATPLPRAQWLWLASGWSRAHALRTTARRPTCQDRA